MTAPQPEPVEVNEFVVGDGEVHRGETYTLDVAMNNSDETITAFSFELYLPEGITVATDEEGYELIELDGANTRRRIDYCGRYIYKNGTLDKVLFDGGYIDRDGGYNYFIKDYQGSVRVVVNEQDSVVESDNYYPYGQLFTEGAPSGYAAQPWKYGGKELDREHGINEHDFGARRQMPQLGMFSTQDPLRWDNPDVSPYLYCAANPINRIDPTGRDVWEIDMAGHIITQTPITDYDSFQIALIPQHFSLTNFITS